MGGPPRQPFLLNYYPTQTSIAYESIFAQLSHSFLIPSRGLQDTTRISKRVYGRTYSTTYITPGEPERKYIFRSPYQGTRARILFLRHNTARPSIPISYFSHPEFVAEPKLESFANASCYISYHPKKCKCFRLFVAKLATCFSPWQACSSTPSQWRNAALRAWSDPQQGSQHKVEKRKEKIGYWKTPTITHQPLTS